MLLQSKIIVALAHVPLSVLQQSFLMGCQLMQQKLKPQQPGTSLYRQITLCPDHAVYTDARVSRDQGSAEVTASLRELPGSSIQACW